MAVKTRENRMKVAVTVWKQRISPVFDASRHLLIAEIDNTRIIKRAKIIFDPGMPSHLARTLKELDVPVLICGAVSQVPATMITSGGITLIPFIAGRVDRVLSAYAQGHSLVPAFVMPGCGDTAGEAGAPVPMGPLKTDHQPLSRRDE